MNGRLEKLDKPATGFGKVTISWENDTPTHYEVKYTRK